MNKLIFLILWFVVAPQLSLSAQRNFFTTSYSPQDIKEMLVTDQSWITYPEYSDRNAWDKLLGNHKEDLIQKGEEYLKLRKN